MAKQKKTSERDKPKKLAEALLLRADLLRKIEQLQNRIRPVLIVSDDKQPQEDPAKLMAQLRKAIQDLEALVVKINTTNNTTVVPGYGNLMQALARRDALKMLSEKLRTIRYAAQINNSGEKVLKTTIDIKKLQAEIDQTGRDFRALDSTIQEINWSTIIKD